MDFGHYASQTKRETPKTPPFLLFYFLSEPLTGSAPFVDIDIRLNMGFPLSAGLVPLFYLLLSGITSDAVSFLNLPDQLLLLAVDDINVIVCLFAPTLFYHLPFIWSEFMNCSFIGLISELAARTFKNSRSD
jgi:hypothetical protein